MKTAHFGIEPLEARIAPAAFIVTTAADSGGGSLRQALLDAAANGTAEADVISFAIGTGAQTIALLSPLSNVSMSVTVDGTTQPGYAGTPLIALDGSGAGAGAKGLVMGYGAAALGLNIRSFASHGVEIIANAVTLKGNWIGVGATGNADAGNGGSGVLVSGGSQVDPAIVIGGTAAGEGNVISGNTRYGVESTGGRVVRILGNFIGTNAVGDAAVANNLGGVLFSNGTVRVDGNVISGNGGTGVNVSTSSFGSTVSGNKIGLDATGTAALPNAGDGVRGVNTPFYSVFGTYDRDTQLTIFGNLIGGNTQNGVLVAGGRQITVSGNHIGVNSAGTAFANGGDGIQVTTAVDLAISGNIISANAGDGIEVFAQKRIIATGNTITANGESGFAASGGQSYIVENVFLGNTGLAIDLLGNGFNSPVLTGASPNGANTLVTGAYNGAASTQLFLHFYALGTGAYLGNGAVSTDASGHGVFNVNVAAVANGESIVATASIDFINGTMGLPEDDGKRTAYTSEFSSPVPVFVAMNATGATLTEGDAGTSLLEFVVNLGAASIGPIGVDYATSGGNATAGSDYATAVGRLIFAPGETTKTVSVVVNGDTTIEPNEFLHFVLSNAAGATLVTSDVLGFIVNDDSPVTPALSVADGSGIEGNVVPGPNWDPVVQLTPINFQVTLSEPQPTPVTVNYSTATGTASNQDYIDISGTITFAPGETTRTITISARGDSLSEPDETFLLNLSAPTGATLLDSQAIGTIVDNEPPSITVGNASIVEGNSGTTNLFFTISLSRALGTALSVSYSTANGTAVASSDFTTTSGTVNFAAGETSKVIAVPIRGDTTTESDEAFTLTASASGAASGTGTGTILNDDVPPPPPTISIADVSITEGDTGTKSAVFTVTLNKAGTGTITVNFATATASAVSGVDFSGTSGSLTFAAGITSQTIVVPILGDTAIEPDETFTIDLTAPSGATLADAQAIGTIQNDDTPPAPPTISIGDVSITEGDTGTKNAIFTVTLNKPGTSTITVNFATATASAVSGVDFSSTSGSLTFAAGITSQTIVVPILGDTAVELDETFTVDLTAPSGATLADAQANGTISNDDVPPPFVPVFTINPARTTATWLDEDGDFVALSVNKPVLDPADFTFSPGANGLRLDTLDLTADGKLARGLILSLTALANAGDGSVNVGAIRIAADATKIHIGGTLGSITAGDANLTTPGLGKLRVQTLGSGLSHITGSVGTIAVSGNWDSATFKATGSIGEVTIGGDLTAFGLNPGGILSDGRIGLVRIGGGISGESSDQPIHIAAARGIEAIIAKHGSAENVNILAGYNTALRGVNGAASIGTVHIGGTWSGGSIVAGALTGDDGHFGTADDTGFRAGGSTIDTVKIGAFAASADTGDHFGIVAHRIATILVGGERLRFTVGQNSMPVPGADDLRVRRVP